MRELMVLTLLPAADFAGCKPPPQRLFVFTFIPSIKKELAAIAALSGKMFVRAASTHNRYVELR